MQNGPAQTQGRTLVPSHRHAMPSGPWPWLDLESETKDDAGSHGASSCSHPNCESCANWLNYPQSLFPNWTNDQVGKRAIMTKAEQSTQCRIYFVDVKEDDKTFDDPIEIATDRDETELWEVLRTPRPPGLRARAFFLENITCPVVKMFGSIYTIEPFFFSSSLNWIPSRYQENVREAKGDHITVILTFLRPVKGRARTFQNRAADTATLINFATDGPVIDTQAPLVLRSDHYEKSLVLDTLAIHLIRQLGNSTIISYHPDSDGRATPTKGLHARFRLAGKSVYWQNIFKSSIDSTFLLLAILWHAVYAWDEALGDLYTHICLLEGIIDTKNMEVTRELHIIRANLLHYASLLTDFRKTVQFVFETRNPALSSCSEDVKKRELELLKRETDNLLSEIARLEMSRQMKDKRLQNVIDLTFSLVNLEDSRHMEGLMKTSIRDSETTKMLSYITMLLLPAIFLSGIFGMNVQEINPGTNGTLAQYFTAVVLLTTFTVWVMVAYQSKYLIPGHSMWVRFLWPVTLARIVIQRQMGKSKGN